MSNLRAINGSSREVARLTSAMTDGNHNQPPMPGACPDYPAPVIVKCACGEAPGHAPSRCAAST